MTGKTDQHPGAQYLAELEASAKKATPGEWDVWREPCADKYAAIEELTEQVLCTHEFAGAVFLLNANGKCPAETGCGPTSEANAAHIANGSPARIAAIAEAFAAEKARADAAEALAKEEGEARDHWFDLATYEVGGVPQHWKDRAERAEATIASLTEQLAEAREALEPRGWFVKDDAYGWSHFDNEVDARLHSEATGGMILVGVLQIETSKTPTDRFAQWLNDGPKLAKAVGVYVGIKVSAQPYARATLSLEKQEGEA